MLKPVTKLLLILFLVTGSRLFAQAPKIIYQPTQTFTVNQAINTVMPNSAGGGPVPPGGAGTVIIFTGNSTFGYADGSATNASFNGSYGISPDAAGNLYIADFFNNMIRKVAVNGDVVTIAGNLTSGYVDANGLNARFANPLATVVDPAGNIYVADNYNNRIRKIKPNGDVTTFAGSGEATSRDGTPTSAAFKDPTGLALDADGNLYVAERDGNKIRKVDPAGNVTTLAGTGEKGYKDGNGNIALFDSPSALAVDSYGNVFVADYFNCVIRKITKFGVVSTYAGNGTQGSDDGVGTAATFKYPIGLTIDNAGNLYAGELFGSIRKITVDQNVTTLANTNESYHITIGVDGQLYVCGVKRIYKVNLFGYSINKTLPSGLQFNTSTGAITGTPTTATPPMVYTVTATNKDGSGSASFSIEVKAAGPVTPPVSGTPPTLSYQTPQTYTRTKTITPLVPAKGGSPVDHGGYGSVTTVTGLGQGTGLVDGGPAVAHFQGPLGIETDAAGNLYVADFENNAIRRVVSDGTVVTVAGGNETRGNSDANGRQAELSGPWGIVRGTAGEFYFADELANCIKKLTPSGDVVTIAGTGSPGKANGVGLQASFNAPRGLAIDAAGNIYVADVGNHLIRIVTPQGVVSNYAGNGEAGVVDGIGNGVSFGSPQWLAIDKAGNLYVADLTAGNIRKIAKDGTVSTFAGNGQSTYANGVGTAAGFQSLGQMTFDSNGDMYVADGNTIRRIQPDATVTKISGNPGVGGSSDGTASTATFGGAKGIVMGVDGALYVTDYVSGRIRKVLLSGYAIDKALPAGLIFDENTGDISGTPTVTSPTTNYTVTARNGFGQTTTKLTITVNDVTPPPASAKPAINYKTPQIYALNVPIQPLVPQSTGGAVDPNGYSIDAPLPAGLSLDPNTGVISGTPTAVSPATIYKVTAVNSVDKSVASINIKVTDVVITAPPAPYIKYESPKTVYVNQDVSLLPTNTGGEVKRYSYALINNFAGTGKAGYNEGPTNTAAFSVLLGLAIDAAGNMYVCDYNNYAIRKITPGGIVSTLTGAMGPGHADGPAGKAQLQGPNGIAIDSKGNLIIADQYAIRKVIPDGTVTTLAGGFTAGYADGTANKAGFNVVLSVAVDNNDNIYVADQGNYAIRKITPTGEVTTFAGDRTRGTKDGIGAAASFAGPSHIIYYKGALYVADYTAIRKITMDGKVTTIAGTGNSTVADGPALSASFGNAAAVAINPAGDIYVLDVGNDVQNETNVVLRRIDANNNVSTVPVVDVSGNQIYLSGQNTLLSTSVGTLYTAGLNNYIQSLSFDRYTINKPLPEGLIFSTVTGEISGKPTKVSAETDYLITAFNAGGAMTTNIKLSVKLSEVKLPSVITFPNPPAPVTWNDTYDYDPLITSSQQETPVKLVSSDESIVRINPDGKTLHIVAVGVATITASQAGNENYLDAEAVTHDVIVEKADPNLQLLAFIPRTTCTEYFVLSSPTDNHQVAVTYESSDPTVATVEQNGAIYILKAGTTTITARQPESSLYSQATEQSKQLVITEGVPVAGPAVKIIVPSPIYEGRSVTFTASASGDIKEYRWTVNDLPVNAVGAEYITSTLVNNDKVACTVIFNDKCTAPSKDEAVIKVLPVPTVIIAPNAFTPNGDGTNDVWRIPALVSYPNCLVSIFNRNGAQLLSSTGYNKPWDGTYNGKALPAGTYYFIIDPRNGESKVSGSVTIIR